MNDFFIIFWLFSVRSVDILDLSSVEDILQVLIVFCVESLELDFTLLYPERHTLLRILPVLVVLASSSDKESESMYKRIKINRLLNIFKVSIAVSQFSNASGYSSQFLCSLFHQFVWSYLTEWSCYSSISGSSPFTSCYHEGIVNVFSKFFKSKSSSHSSRTPWNYPSWAARISFDGLWFFSSSLVSDILTCDAWYPNV